MKKTFVTILIALFTLAAASLVMVQYVQMKRAFTVSENLFNINVNNAMDDMINDLNRTRVEDYLRQNDRYKLLKFRRVEELNERMQNIVKENYNVFFDTALVEVGVTMIDSIHLLPNAKVTVADSNAIAEYNMLLTTRDKLINSDDFYDQFVTDISDYVADNLLTSKVFKYEILDSIITEKLTTNGVDVKPVVGVLDYTNDNILYCSKGDGDDLRETPFKYSFHPSGIMSPNEYFIVLSFPKSTMLMKDNSTLYFAIGFLLISLIFILFFLSLRTIFKQDKLDEMKTDFINNMTHEIKTPIATIGLACEMLQDKSIDTDSASRGTYVGIINDENRRMRMLIETILQNSKMSNKNFSLNRNEIDLHRITESVLKSFQLIISNRGGVIESDLEANPSTFFGDEIHITNMIYNLVDNAIKYSPNTLHIKIATRLDGKNIVLKVADKGLGISKEDQKHIFEKFYRVSTGDVHNVKGFGIGLNYVQQVVSLHEGSIEVDSTLGEGTTFTITFPRAI